MTTLLPFLFVVLFVSCVSGMIVQQVFTSRLRKLHTETWVQLGKPVIFLNSGFLNTCRFIRFMWRKDYEALPDKKTVALGRFLRAFLIVYTIFFVMLVVIFLVTVNHSHK
jgi:hypothetical protein